MARRALGFGFGWLSCICVWADAIHEVHVQLQNGGSLALSTEGPSAFRVRLQGAAAPILSPMVNPDARHAPFKHTTSMVDGQQQEGIATDFGSVTVTRGGVLRLYSAEGRVLTTSAPVAGNHLVLSTGRGSLLYGRGASIITAPLLTTLSEVVPRVFNKAVWVPYYYCTDGYSALGVVPAAVRSHYPARYTHSTLQQRITWDFAGAHREIYLMPASSLADGTKAYFQLTGSPRVPPLYAFGFMASRWGWKDSAYVEEVVRRFRSERLPLDAIIFDFEWYTPHTDYGIAAKGDPGFVDFGYNSAIFNNPKHQLDRLHRLFNVHVGGIRKPRLANSALIEEARRLGALYDVPPVESDPAFQTPNEGDWRLRRPARELDFSKPAARAWYSGHLDRFVRDGMDFWWNDEGEDDFFMFHWWNMAEVESLVRVKGRGDSPRFFSLNRAWTPGMARLGAAVWTGDIKATWEDLRSTPGMMLNWALAGAPYVACDIGGFYGEPSAELLTRWMQLGAFLPLMRVHSVDSSKPHWPFEWGREALGAMRKALELRYRLILYHYSLAHAMFQEQQLWMRPMAMDYPHDPALAALTSQWMDGRILAAPIQQQDSRRNVHLPRGVWYDLDQGLPHLGPVVLRSVAPIDAIPAFVAAGTILPLAPVVQHTGALPGGHLEVRVYAGSDASFDLVEDDGRSTDYLRGLRRILRFRWTEANSTLSWTTEGKAPGRHARLFTELSAALYAGDGAGRVHTVAHPIGTAGRLFLGHAHSHAFEEKAKNTLLQ